MLLLAEHRAMYLYQIPTHCSFCSATANTICQAVNHAVKGVCVVLHLLLGGAVLLCTLLQHMAHLLSVSIAVVHDARGHLVVPACTPCLLHKVTAYIMACLTCMHANTIAAACSHVSLTSDVV